MKLDIDESLLDCIVEGTLQGLEMTGIAPRPVGASSLISATRPYSVLVSLTGRQNGTLTLNFSERAVVLLTARLLGEDAEDMPLDEDTFDGICEVGNIIAGRVKKLLSHTKYAFDHISIPALVLGASYDLYHARGIVSASVEFEIAEIPTMYVRDKFFTCAVSLMQV